METDASFERAVTNSTRAQPELMELQRGLNEGHSLELNEVLDEGHCTLND